MDKLTKGQKQVLAAILDAAPKVLVFNLNGKKGVLREQGIEIPLGLPTDYKGDLWNDTYIVKAYLNDYGFTAPVDDSNFQSQIKFTQKGRELVEIGSIEKYDRLQRKKQRSDFLHRWMPSYTAVAAIIISLAALGVSIATCNESRLQRLETKAKQPGKSSQVLSGSSNAYSRKDTSPSGHRRDSSIVR